MGGARPAATRRRVGLSRGTAECAPSGARRAVPDHAGRRSRQGQAAQRVAAPQRAVARGVGERRATGMGPRSHPTERATHAGRPGPPDRAGVAYRRCPAAGRRGGDATVAGRAMAATSGRRSSRTRRTRRPRRSGRVIRCPMGIAGVRDHPRTQERRPSRRTIRRAVAAAARHDRRPTWPTRSERVAQQPMAADGRKPRRPERAGRTRPRRRVRRADG
jgi:hypothetical protein